MCAGLYYFEWSKEKSNMFLLNGINHGELEAASGNG